jgi:hypothetical protein
MDGIPDPADQPKAEREKIVLVAVLVLENELHKAFAGID